MDALLDLRDDREVGEATNTRGENLAVNQVVDYRLAYKRDILLVDEGGSDDP